MRAINSFSQRAFTLIEILIALAIVAISILAIANGMNQYTRITGELEKRVVASWVAANVAAELRHSARYENIRTGNSSDVIEMGGYTWRASSRIAETDVTQVFLLIIRVEDEDSRVDTNYATLTTALSRT